MNLNGRDVRLRKIKSGPKGFRQLFYRFGDLRITVAIDDFKPESAEVVEGDHMFKMKITLRRGRAVRVVHAVGSADC
jgi:hypothetical protein